METDLSLFKYLVQGVKDYAIFALDPSGRVMTWNAGAEHAKGYRAEEIIGKHFSAFYTADSVNSNHPGFELEQALTNGSYEEEGWRVRKDGTRYWANVIITALYDDDRKHIGFAKVTRDLTERRRADEERIRDFYRLQKSEETFNLMVAAVKDYAIFAISPEGFILSWNEGAKRIKGYEPEEVIGQHISIFYSEENRQNKHPDFELREALRTGSYEEEGWRFKKDGSRFWASVTITPFGGETGGFVKVTRDLTERKRAEDELAEARDHAITANQLKSQFVANVTHEIRTPLSGVIGLGELLAANPDLDSETHEAAVRSFEASKQLLTILNQLLDFAKLESGRVDIVSDAYHPAVVIDEVVGLTEARANAKGLELSVSLVGVPDTVIGDQGKVRQILLNLVHNAIKFTQAGAVHIRLEYLDNQLQFSVTDTGIGVKKECQERLFLPFSQAFDSASKTFGGTGLGLSIAQQYVHLMGGKIGLVSDEGRGTTVWFNLPATNASLPRASEGGV
jgi:PAS domain S-box-containing protein